jgi:acetoin utilization deacetylase AcuC-like enzyme
MGFCLLNNVAITAGALREVGERVLIVDWDVHHGNGTQDVFWDDPDVLYVSTHQWPAYPGTGRADEVGGVTGRGATVNVPLPPGATGDVIRQAFDTLVTPVVEAFAPTWVLVSAGFDAHRGDPLADLALSAGDFAELAGTVAGYAPGPGRLVLFLEGGYDLDALRMSVAATLGRLVGAPDSSERPTSGGPGTEHVELAAARRRAALDDG